MTTLQTGYDYAGFRYVIVRLDDGTLDAIPEAGQHPAAGKQKHRMAAVDCWRLGITQPSVK